MNNNQLTGMGFVFFASICFSAKAVMIKLAYQYSIDPLSLLFLRMVFSLPFFIIIPLILYRKRPEQKPVLIDYIKLVLLGVLGYYASSILDFIGLQYITASLERLILFIYPTIVVILLFVFYKQQITSKQLMALGLTYGGIMCVFLNDTVPNQAQQWVGSLYIFASACTYAVYLIGSGRLIPRFGSVHFTAYVMIISCLSVIIHFMWVHADLLFNFSKEILLLGAALAVFSTVIPTFMVSEGIKRIGAGKAAIIGSIGPVTTIALGYFFLHETVTIYELIGTGMVLGGVLLVSANK